jgi:hypothetical protein
VTASIKIASEAASAVAAVTHRFAATGSKKSYKQMRRSQNSEFRICPKDIDGGFKKDAPHFTSTYLKAGALNLDSSAASYRTPA